jgi:hypothetical protein
MQRIMSHGGVLRSRVLLLAAIAVAPTVARATLLVDTSRPVQVIKPVTLPATMPADRMALGQGYKPTMAMLPNGELVLMSFYWEGSDSNGTYHEYSKLWRSDDYGKTWSAPVRVQSSPGHDLIGREHYLTAINDGTPNGILFSTASIIGYDTAAPAGFLNHPPAYINRSTDGGRTWTQIQIGPGGFVGAAGNWVGGQNGAVYSRVDRNVVQMPDGRLVLGVGHFDGGPGTEDYLWTSTDKGLTWQQSPRMTFGTYRNYQGEQINFFNGCFVDETYIDRNDAGQMTAYLRLNALKDSEYRQANPLFPMGPNSPSAGEWGDRIIKGTSTDGGLTWTNFQDVGNDYGQMYPNILHLKDGRTLLTFTQRAGTAPIGVRAVLSNDDGQTWNFARDQIILDANTPSGWASGGGFGNTIQLPDGSLISCYSYPTNPNGWDNAQSEVVRWSLPVPEPSAVVLLAIGAVFLGLVISSRVGRADLAASPTIICLPNTQPHRRTS